MIALRVEAVTGHWLIPGQVNQGGLAFSYSMPPPSNVQGFLEALGGSGFHTFQGRFAYGLIRDPGGHGLLPRIRHVWGSNPNPRCAGDKELTRLVQSETWLDLAFCVLVDGPWEERIRAALRGDVTTYGVLYLGTSDDMVHWLGEMADPMDHVQWLVPGSKLRLPVTTSRGHHTIDYQTRTFDLKVGDPHWVVDTGGRT